MPATSPSPQRLTIRSKVLLGFGVVLAMLVVITTVSIRSTRGFIRTADWVARTRETLEIQERLLRQLLEMESSRRGFLVSGDESLLKRYEEAHAEIIRNYNDLKLLTADSASQSQRLEELKAAIQQSIALQGAEIEARRTGGLAAGAALFSDRRTEEATERIRTLLTELTRDARGQLAERSLLTDRIGAATTTAVALGAALTGLALVIACGLILRDVAARRRAEEALASEHNLLSSIINAMPNHVYVKDAKGRYILDNDAHRRYLGLEDAHAVEGKTVHDYYTPAMASRYEADDRQVLSSGEALLNHEEPALRAATDGGDTWLETNKVPLRDTDGQIVGLVGISSDISARKEAEEQLRQFAEKLERSNAELQNFASVASHDLQEPLRKIQAFGDRLMAKCGDQMGEQGRDYLGRMQNAAGRMQVLIQDLLKLSRVTSRAQPFERCDLAEIVRAVLSDLEVAVEQTGARVEVGTLPVIDADPLQMRQLFQNLIANAIKFQKPAQAPEVSVAGRVFDMQEPVISGASIGDKVCQIRVEDNGIGFDAKFADQIFVVFQRLHSREEYEGTGIGLAVCRKITDRHGGSIVAKSSEGQGATFLITLPVVQPSNRTNE